MNIKLISFTSFLLMIFVVASCGKVKIQSNYSFENANIYKLSDNGNNKYLFIESRVLSNKEHQNLQAASGNITLHSNIGEIDIDLSLATLPKSKDSVLITRFAIFEIKQEIGKRGSDEFKYQGKNLIASDTENLTNDDLFLIADMTSAKNQKYFKVFAIRLHENNEVKYFPSSEKLRIEVRKPKGLELWTSNYEMNYLTVIMNVEPENIGDVYTYEMQWDGVCNNTDRISSGIYPVSFILPAQPKAYFIQHDIYMD